MSLRKWWVIERKTNRQRERMMKETKKDKQTERMIEKDGVG